MKVLTAHAEKLEAALWWLLVVWIPFGTRKFILSFAPQFSEYESVFVYASDFLIAGLAVLLLWRLVKKFFSRVPKLLWIFLAVAAASVVLAFHVPLALYSFGRLVLAALFFVITAYVLEAPKKFDAVLKIVAASSVFQALVGIAQFFTQQSIGLRLLGESQIGIHIVGAAKVYNEYGYFLRAYGTLPHANIYAAFLVLGLISLCYFWVRRKGEFRIYTSPTWLAQDVLLGISIFLVLMGLVVSFSRSGWISAMAGIVCFFALSSIRRGYRLEVARLVVVLFVSVVLLYQLFQFAISPRIEATYRGDYSISSRLMYNKLGVDLIKERPWGVGIGNQMPHAVTHRLYQNLGMTQRWEWQPIHNLYILMAAEIGIAGLAAFFVLLIFVLRGSGFKNQIVQLNPQKLVSVSLLFALLIFGLFDHFLWDLQPGRLMLWLVLGSVAARRNYNSSH